MHKPQSTHLIYDSMRLSPMMFIESIEHDFCVMNAFTIRKKVENAEVERRQKRTKSIRVFVCRRFQSLVGFIEQAVDVVA